MSMLSVTLNLFAWVICILWIIVSLVRQDFIQAGLAFVLLTISLNTSASLYLRTK